MKRKLNNEDAPVPVAEDKPASKSASFESFGLDPRLLQAIAAQKYSAPTEVQSKTIPLALTGKDVLARSKTGSGKSAAYVLPILQSILKHKKLGKKARQISALVLVPTRELAQQITKVVTTFASSCGQDVQVVNLTQKVPEAVLRTLLAKLPDIVIATPARVAQKILNSTLDVEKLQYLVVDEADLVLSYGYEEDFKAITEAVPKGVQTILMSATLSTEVDTLKGLLCRDPVVLDLKETAEEDSGVSQYVVNCAEDEKFLLVYVVYKLKLIKGKSIIFVGDIDRSYRLKLYFEQFGISSCVLNSELPVNSRIHVVEEFNKNVYDIIIASDEHEVVGGDGKPETQENGDDDEGQQNESNNGTTDEPAKPKRKRSKKSKQDKEYGISRGIDFQNVACVLNFDLPTTSDSYIHRIGRTARAGKTGMALSFVVPQALYRKHKPTTTPTSANDEAVLASITTDQAAKGNQVHPYHFDMAQVNAFRYRMDDALRAVTPAKVREARVKELRQELLRSEKLKRHFEEHPDDLRFLMSRHDGESGVVRRQPHLKHVPDYLMPRTGARGVVKDQEVGFVGLRKPDGERNRLRRIREFKRGRGKGKGGRGGTSGGGRRKDVLKTLKTR